MRQRRWGSVLEIKGVSQVGDPVYNALPRRLKHLAAWRGAHAVASHSTVRRFARSQGVKPSSDLPLRSKVELIRVREKK